MSRPETKQEALLLQNGYITIRRVAERTGLHVTTIYRAITNGELSESEGPGLKALKLSDVVAWLGPEKARAAGFVPDSKTPAPEAPK